mmetsp:Transcript_132729/g.229733  ORF Transcript_132729/g.229733 Transcript_132729/m.229733 type:complete len:101 (-) Transcript_132729:246-548(-)
MAHAMAVEAVRECSGFTEEQSERLLCAAGYKLEDALDMLYDENNELVLEIKSEQLPPTVTPSYIPASWQQDVAETAQAQENGTSAAESEDAKTSSECESC